MNKFARISILFVSSLLFSLNAKAATCDDIVDNYSNAIAELARGYINLEKLETEGLAPAAIYISINRELEQVQDRLIEKLGEEKFFLELNKSLKEQGASATVDERVRRARREKRWQADKNLHPYVFKYEVESEEVTVTKDGLRFLNVNQNTEVSMYDFGTGKKLYSFPDASPHVHKIKMSPDEKYVAHLDFHKKFILWDAQSGEVIYSKVMDDELLDVDFTPDSELMAVKKVKGKVFLLNTKEASLVRTFDLKSAYTTSAIQFSRDGLMLLTSIFLSGSSSIGPTKVVQIWDIKTAAELFSFKSNEGVISAKWQPAGNQILLYQSNKIFSVWDPLTDKKISFEGYLRPQWSHDGKFIAASIFGEEISIWKVSNLKRPYKKIKIGAYSVGPTAFSPDMKQIAGVCGDGYVRIWDFASGALKDEFEGDFKSLNWSHDGEKLIGVARTAFISPKISKAYIFQREAGDLDE